MSPKTTISSDVMIIGISIRFRFS